MNYPSFDYAPYFVPEGLRRASITGLPFVCGDAGRIKQHFFYKYVVELKLYSKMLGILAVKTYNNMLALSIKI
jgi:hypothetical protein